jgi:glycosyltransferase involved in cell wall biosynthesis
MPGTKRVVMLSDAETFGGAAISASRLAGGFACAGLDVVRIVGNPDHRKHPWTTEILDGAPIRRRHRLLIRTIGCLSTQMRDELQANLEGKLRREKLVRLLGTFKPDFINVHNLHGMRWSPGLIDACCAIAPTIWTLHDMWSFTGRCGYAKDCRKFTSGCDAACPTPTEYPALAPEKIANAFSFRSRLFAAHPNLVAACPSRWLKQEALSGLWAGHRVEHIPYGLPLDAYAPIDRQVARLALGIASSGPVVMVAAWDLGETRKGGAVLPEVLSEIRYRPLTLLTLGGGQIPRVPDGVSVHELGYVDYERIKVLAYNAADLLLHPAPVDNLPNVVMEAIACGTPCAAFPIGGLPDMVRHGTSGWLSDEINPESLARTVDRALDAIGSGTDLRTSCRKLAENEYDARLQASRYLDLFAQLGKACRTPAACSESVGPQAAGPRRNAQAAE